MKIDLRPFVTSVSNKGLDLIGVNVRQHNEEIGDYLWRTNDRLDIKSSSKGVTCLAVGMAIDEGLFTLDDKVADFFREEIPKDILAAWEKVEIRHLLMMATGHDHNVIVPSNFAAAGKHWISYIFQDAPVLAPGTKFIYNNACPYLCGCIIEKLSGLCLRDWLMPRLFDPLDIFDPQWFSCPDRHTRCMGGLFLNRYELAKLGQLCLNKGKWNGIQLISADWIQLASQPHIMQHSCVDDVKKEPEKDFATGYGFFWWRNAVEGYRFNGRYGQFCLVLPEHDAVITTTGLEQYNEQGILDSIWEEIFPRLS